MTKVCHITSVHPKEDVRIYKKECISLAKAGYDVYLVQQGDSYEKEDIHVIGFGDIAKSRVKRIMFTAKKAYKKAVELDADVYHLHDPELLPYGIKLKKNGKKVIFDSHEDVPADILEKEWIPSFMRNIISNIYSRYESKCISRLDGVIGVTPTLCDRLDKIGPHSAMITNYPIWNETQPEPEFSKKKIAFTGLISPLWSITNLVKALDGTDVTLELRSRNADGKYIESLSALPAWEQVNYPGSVPHSEVLKLLSQCMCGIALLKPCPNSGWQTGTLGNTKIFEYMMAGIPVICTDFDLWKEIIDKWNCGIYVNVNDITAINTAIKKITQNPEYAKELGINGRNAVYEYYNWSSQETILLSLYNKIFK